MIAADVSINRPSGLSGVEKQSYINTEYVNGYYRTFSHPLVQTVINELYDDKSKMTFSKFKKLWEKMQSEPELHFDLNYTKPRASKVSTNDK
jgi:hypothetical protein